MSWANELYNIYERYCGNDFGGEPLLPIFHSTANAQIELVISEHGDYRSASKIAKNDMVTIIPVTEKSGARTSGCIPHPYADKLVYIAGDYEAYAQGKRVDNSSFYNAYTEQLKCWMNSEFSVPAVNALYTYIEKKTLIKDLINERVLETDPDTGKLSGAKINGIAQEDCMVRVRIEYSDPNKESRTWADKELYDSFIAWNSSNMGDKQLCYATGKELSATYTHPNKLRNAGDKGKLISTNDESGFSYRGRFSDKTEAASVSYEFSQKMHNALKWLIAKQAVHFDSLAVLVWNAKLSDLPNVSDAGWDIPGLDMPIVNERDKNPSELGALYKKQLFDSVFGHKSTLSPEDNTMVMMLDSATTGRLSMSMYTELKAGDFIGNLSKWHSETAWYRFNGREKTNMVSSFSMRDIAKCAFGLEKGDFLDCKAELLADTAARLIPCAVEGRRIPVDVVRSLVNKAENPLAYKKDYNWRTVLEAACGFYRKYLIDYNKGGIYSMALDKECTSRDYLYGRLLAVADKSESSTYKKGEERTTNARNFFNAFSNHPYTSWGVIENKLAPYFKRMSEGSRIYYQKLIDEIMDKFDRNEFMDNSKLKPEFLLGYHCQLSEIYKKSNNNEEE